MAYSTKKLNRCHYWSIWSNFFKHQDEQLRDPYSWKHNNKMDVSKNDDFFYLDCRVSCYFTRFWYLLSKSKGITKFAIEYCVNWNHAPVCGQHSNVTSKLYWLLNAIRRQKVFRKKKKLSSLLNVIIHGILKHFSNFNASNCFDRPLNMHKLFGSWRAKFFYQANV